MGRKGKGLLAGIRQHNAASLANLRAVRPQVATGQAGNAQAMTADDLLATMKKLTDALPKDSGPMVIVAGAGIMPLAEAVTRFGDKLVHVDNVGELLSNHALRPFSTFKDLAVCPCCGTKGGAHTTITSPEGKTINCPVAESFVLMGQLGEAYGQNMKALRDQAFDTCAACGGTEGRHLSMKRPGRPGFVDVVVMCPVEDAEYARKHAAED